MSDEEIIHRIATVYLCDEDYQAGDYQEDGRDECTDVYLKKQLATVSPSPSSELFFKDVCVLQLTL